MRGVPGLAACALLAACSLGGPRVVPVTGALPAVVLVAPPTGPWVTPELAAALMATAEPALRARGYYALPVEVTVPMLAAMGLDAASADPAELAAAARTLGADAFLTMNVEDWDGAYAPTLVWLDYEIDYRLRRASDGAAIWELRAYDEWAWSEEMPPHDPDAALDDFLGFGARSEAFSPYRDDVDTARAIQRSVMLRLPRGPLR